MSRFSIPTILFLALTGCQLSGPPQPADPPSDVKLLELAASSYAYSFGKAPEKLRLDSLGHYQVFPDREELIACVSTTEHTPGPTYNSHGDLILPEGAPYRESWAMLVRYYDYGWGSGIFRRTGGKIGLMSISEMCG
ncbi:MAG: hypothetical protein P8X66_14835 [Maritimibacter sp.]